MISSMQSVGCSMFGGEYVEGVTVGGDSFTAHVEDGRADSVSISRAGAHFHGAEADAIVDGIKADIAKWAGR